MYYVIMLDKHQIGKTYCYGPFEEVDAVASYEARVQMYSKIYNIILTKECEVP